MDLNLAKDHVESFKIFQGRILSEYAKVAVEYGLTEIDATMSISHQQQIVREYLDETLADYQPPEEQEAA